MKSGADCGEIAAFVEEMSRRRKLALTYFHPRLHAPAAAQLRRERNVVWDRRLGVYLFPDRATLDRCRAACEALDARAAADERARLEAAGYDVPEAMPEAAPPLPLRLFTIRKRRAVPVGAILHATPARIAEGYPAHLRVVSVKTVLLPAAPTLGTRDPQEVYVMTCEEAQPPAPAEAIDRLEDEA